MDLLFVQPVDKPRTIKFFQESRIDKVLRVGGLRGGDLLRKLGKYGLETFQRGLGLDRNQAFEQLIAFLELFWHPCSACICSRLSWTTQDCVRMR